MKGLGKIDRKGKCLIHWAMESRRGHEKLINGYGISKGKSNLAIGSFGFLEWDGHQWFGKRNLILNEGNFKKYNLNNKEIFDRKG